MRLHHTVQGIWENSRLQSQFFKVDQGISTRAVQVPPQQGEREVCPRFIRVDRGSETNLMVTLHGTIKDYLIKKLKPLSYMHLGPAGIRMRNIEWKKEIFWLGQETRTMSSMDPRCLMLLSKSWIGRFCPIFTYLPFNRKLIKSFINTTHIEFGPKEE